MSDIMTEIVAICREGHERALRRNAMAMDQEPDRSEAYWQGHFGTKTQADAYAADIEKIAGEEGHEIPRTEVAPDRQGGWNVWIWEG